MRTLVFLSGAVLLAAGTGALAGSTAPRTVSGTVDQSEWAEPGQLTVDLDSGVYSVTPGVWASGERKGQPRGKVLSGTVQPAQLMKLNALAETASANGLVDTQCAATDRSERPGIVVSNGGEQTIALTLDGERETAHPDLECWTAAATELHRGMQALVDAERTRQP